MPKSNDYKKVGNQGWCCDGGTPRSETNKYCDELAEETPSTGKSKKKKKQTKKANHKHEYRDVLCKTADGHLHTGQQCKVCGKLQNINYFMFGKTAYGYLKILSDTEIRKQYPDLDIVDIE